MNFDKPLVQNSFSLNVLTLAGGTAIAQAVGILVVPLLTRLYTPSDFGNYSLYTAAFNLLVPLAHFRYAAAIMLPKEDQEALEVLRLSLRLSVFFGITFFAIFLFNDFTFFQLPGVTDNPWVFALASLALIFGGSILSFSVWANRMKNYFLMSLARISEVSGMVISQSIAGIFLGSTVLGLIYGHILGQTLRVTLLATGNKTLKSKPLFFSPVAPLINCMSRYKNFPLYNSWGTLLAGAASHGPPLLFAIYFQPDMVGKYALAATALTAPVMLVGNSIAQVLYQKMSENIQTGVDIKELVRSVLIRQFFISLFFGVTVYFYGPALFGFLFGDRWASSGQFAQILVPVMFFHLISTSVSSVLLVKERQDLLLFVQILRALATVGSILASGMMGLDEIESLTVFSYSRALAHMVYLVIICKVARLF